MSLKQQYSIGELSQLCNVSKKALRFYDKIGLISSLRHDYNNYRMYTHDELLLVPVLKFYKQMGFKLDEVRTFITGHQTSVHDSLRKAFEEKLQELKNEQAELHRNEETVGDWLRQIREAEQVIAQNIREVSVKYVEPASLLFQEQPFNGQDIKPAIVNLDFLNYVEKTGKNVCGPVFLHFADMQKRIDGEAQTVRIMQKTLQPGDAGGYTDFGGCMMASCYHIGPLENVAETYERFQQWLQQHGYARGQDCYERYVTDYWTTGNSEHHVTELLVRMSREHTK